jgi:anti-anti-sigma regulatory factor
MEFGRRDGSGTAVDHCSQRVPLAGPAEERYAGAQLGDSTLTAVPNSGDQRNPRTSAGSLQAGRLAMRVSLEQGRIVIHPLGHLDAGNRNQLFCRCLAPGHHHVVLDMTYVNSVDLEGVAGVLATRHVLESEGGSLSIRHASGQPAEALVPLTSART